MKPIKSLTILALLILFTATHFRAHKLQVFVIPSTKITEAGSTYSAEIVVLGGKPSAIKVGGKPLEVHDNKANVSFSAPLPPVLDRNGIGELNYTITIESPEDEVLEKKVTYYVRKQFILTHISPSPVVYKGVPANILITIPGMEKTKPTFQPQVQL